MLHNDIRSCWRQSRKCQRIVKKAVDKSEEEWICAVATQVEEAVKDEKVRWSCICRLQQVVYRPVRPAAILKEDGQLTQGPAADEVLEQWYEHFNKLLRKCEEGVQC